MTLSPVVSRAGAPRGALAPSRPAWARPRSVTAAGAGAAAGAAGGAPLVRGRLETAARVAPHGRERGDYAVGRLVARRTSGRLLQLAHGAQDLELGAAGRTIVLIQRHSAVDYRQGRPACADIRGRPARLVAPRISVAE